MNLIAHYNHMYHNWYVGELYKKLLDKISEIEGINLEIRHTNELSSHMNIPTDYHNGLPSILSCYNLLIQNKDNGKTFIHSFQDYAPAMLDDRSGISNFDVSMFACASRLDQTFIDTFSHKTIVQPSIYILELLDEHNMIEKNRFNPKINPKLYFNGLCYGIRETYRNILSQSEFFDFRKKDTAEFYKSKELYYNELSNYKNGFNLDGAAKICYRDLEYFGMGTLLFREKLDVLTYEPIIDGRHYVTIIDDDIKSKIHDPSNYDYIINKLENNIKEIIENEKLVTDIVGEARGYFERNVLPENQVEILFSFLKDFEIFK
jgi:hypothetical protein